MCFPSFIENLQSTNSKVTDRKGHERALHKEFVICLRSFFARKTVSRRLSRAVMLPMKVIKIPRLVNRVHAGANDGHVVITCSEGGNLVHHKKVNHGFGVRLKLCNAIQVG